MDERRRDITCDFAPDADGDDLDTCEHAWTVVRGQEETAGTRFETQEDVAWMETQKASTVLLLG
eukprot:3241413-Rhodomonas_salina.2